MVNTPCIGPESGPGATAHEVDIPCVWYLISILDELGDEGRVDRFIAVVERDQDHGRHNKLPLACQSHVSCSSASIDFTSK